MIYQGVADVVHLHLLGATSEIWIISSDQVYVATHLGSGCHIFPGITLLITPDTEEDKQEKDGRKKNSKTSHNG